jgi:hypothetical protein
MIAEPAIRTRMKIFVLDVTSYFVIFSILSRTKSYSIFHNKKSYPIVDDLTSLIRTAF